MPTLVWSAPLAKTVPNGKWGALRETRQGVCVHYDASSSDAGSVSWFENPACNVSYQLLVLDDGSYVRIAPDNKRAWHAGRCKPSDKFSYTDANSALYGIAAATNNKVDVTPVQMLTIAWLVRKWFATEGWPVTDLWRITGHEDECDPPGRKKDPSGGLGDNPIFTAEDIRQLVPLISV